MTHSAGWILATALVVTAHSAVAGPHPSRVSNQAATNAATPTLSKVGLETTGVAADDVPRGASDGEETVEFIDVTDGSCLNLRSLPTTLAPALTCVPVGTAVTVIKRVPQWRKGRLASGQEGWLAARFLASSPSVAPSPQPRRTTDPQGGAPAGDTWQPAEPTDIPGPTDVPEPADALEEAEYASRQLLEEIDSSEAALRAAELQRNEVVDRLMESTVLGLESRLSLARDELGRMESARRALLDEIARLARESEELEQGLEAARASEAGLQAGLAETAAQLADAQAVIAQSSAERDQVLAELSVARTDLARTKEKLERLTDELAETRSTLARTGTVAEVAKEALGVEIRQNEAVLTGLREALAAKEEELGAAKSELAAVNGESAAPASELDRGSSDSRSELRRELKETRLALQRVTREKQALEAWLEERCEVPPAEAKVTIMQSEIDRLAVADSRDPRELEAAPMALREARLQAIELERELVERDRQSANLQAEIMALRRSAAPADGPQEALAGALLSEAAKIMVLPSAAPCLDLRAEPQPDGESLACLKPGTLVGPLGQWEYWHYVELSDGRAGWIASRHLGPAGAPGSSP